MYEQKFHFYVFFFFNNKQHTKPRLGKKYEFTKTNYKFKIQITIVYVYENNIINKISKIRFNVTH